MFEDFSAEAVAKQVLADLEAQGTWSVEEGTLPYTLVLPLCVEIANIYANMDTLATKLFVHDSSGPFLDLASEAYGIYRKAGTKASCEISLSGEYGAVVSAGTQFLTADGLIFLTDNDVVLDSSGAVVTATSSEVGNIYNIGQNELIATRQGLIGIFSHLNTAAVGGTDEESDAALFARLDLHRKEPATSGNVTQYRLWALAVDGVGYAKILPLFSGAGTVRVVLASPIGDEVSEDIVNDCYNQIESVRPIGATVSVVSAMAVGVTVNANIVIDGSVSESVIIANINKSISEYLTQLLDIWQSNDVGYSVLYNRVLAIILSVQGVVDCPLLQINGKSENLILQPDEVGGVLEVNVNVTF